MLINKLAYNFFNKRTLKIKLIRNVNGSLNTPNMAEKLQIK